MHTSSLCSCQRQAYEVGHVSPALTSRGPWCIQRPCAGPLWNVWHVSPALTSRGPWCIQGPCAGLLALLASEVVQPVSGRHVDLALMICLASLADQHGAAGFAALLAAYMASDMVVTAWHRLGHEGIDFGSGPPQLGGHVGHVATNSMYTVPLGQVRARMLRVQPCVQLSARGQRYRVRGTAARQPRGARCHQLHVHRAPRPGYDLDLAVLQASLHLLLHQHSLHQPGPAVLQDAWQPAAHAAVITSHSSDCKGQIAGRHAAQHGTWGAALLCSDLAWKCRT